MWPVQRTQGDPPKLTFFANKSQNTKDTSTKKYRQQDFSMINFHKALSHTTDVPRRTNPEHKINNSEKIGRAPSR